jgi:hypothetical protein
MVAGTLALLFEANPSLSPNAAKAILLYTAEKMVEPDLFSQGNGMLNSLGAVALARSISGNSKSIQVNQLWLAASSREEAKGIVQPYNRIADETIWWGAAFTYGNGILWTHDNLSWTGQDVWGQGILWTHGILWSFGSAWIDDLMAFKQAIYSDGILWTHDNGHSSYLWADGILWTHSELEAMGIIWTHTILWSNADLLGLWSPGLIDPYSVDLFGDKRGTLVDGEDYSATGYSFGDQSAPYYPDPPDGQ